MSEDIKIGFVNTDRVFREADPAIEALKKLEKEFADREEDIKKIRSNIKKLQEKFEKDNLTLSDSQKRNMEQKILKNSRELQRTEREFREDLNLRKNEELSVVLQSANEVIKEIAEKENFDLILQEAVYRSSKIDITDKVIEALSKK